MRHKNLAVIFRNNSSKIVHLCRVTEDLIHLFECNIDNYNYYLDFTQCDCNSNSYYGVNQGGGSLICIPCTTGVRV